MSSRHPPSVRRLLGHFQMKDSGHPSQGQMRPPGDLMCRKGCGFYGNPEWQWHCSKCWRQQQQQQQFHLRGQHRSPSKAKRIRKPDPDGDVRQKMRSPEVSKRPGPQESTSLRRSASTASAKQEKSLKSMLRIRDRPGTPTEAQRSPPKAAGVSVPPEAKPYQSQLIAFLTKKLDPCAMVEISRMLKAFIDKVKLEADVSDIEELSNLAQEFYQNLRRRLNDQEIFQSLSDSDIDRIVDLTEKFALVTCSKHLFCPHFTDDEEKDLTLQNRIRRLNWITTKDLSCVINESSQEVRDALHMAINRILEMDAKLTPEEKLECLVQCSKNIFDMLKHSNEQPASADEFLPCLIYVCLKANPPRMYSNINFITRFRNEEKLRMGEAGYFFANLCCAISFIDNMTAESVNMDPEEFDSYVSGKAIPPGSWKSSLLMCESLQAMSQDLKLLSELRTRYDKVLKETQELQEHMKNFQTEISSEVESVLERTKYTIRGPRKPVTLDDESLEPPNKAELPEPLLPGLHEAQRKLEDVREMGDTDDSHFDSFDYRGFSVQNAEIPSIPCSNVAPTESKKE